MRIPHRLLWIAAAIAAVAAGSVGAAVLAQPNVAQQQQAAIGSGKGVKIGYISNKEAVPIVHVISVGIQQQAKRAGVQLVFCDAAGDTAKALDCAKNFKTQGVQGILNFQHDATASPSICSAGPSVPTIAIDIPQKPCQVAFMGVDNAYGGMIAGKELGAYFKSHFNCQYDAWISLEEPEIGAVNELRMGGYRKGFQTVSRPDQEPEEGRLRRVGGSGAHEDGRPPDVPPGQAPAPRRLDGRRGRRGRVRRGEGGRTADRPLGCVARRRRQDVSVRHQDEPELGGGDGDLP